MSSRMRVANVSTDLEGPSRLWKDCFLAGGGEMEVSTRVASDELLTRGDGLIWMDVVGCEDGSACVRGIAGMGVEGGWTTMSGSSDVESMSMDVSMRFSSVASIIASAFPSSRMSSMMVMMVGVD